MPDSVDQNIKSTVHLEESYGRAEDVGTVLELADALLSGIGIVFPQVKKLQSNIAQIGGIVKLFAGMTDSSEPDPVLQKLKELDQKMNQLADKMAGHFAEMRGFITEVTFLNNIAMSSSTLMKFMRDCMKHPNTQTKDNFEDAYNDRKPLTISYNMISLLENDRTNPLKMAMAADPLRSKTTFDGWHKKIDGFFSELLFLELFAAGLLKDKFENANFNAKLMIEKADDLWEEIKKWKKKYMDDTSYFIGVKSYVETMLETNSAKKTNEIMTEMKAYLEKELLTTDALYLVVYKEEVNYLNYGISLNPKMIEIRHKGGRGAIIHRSYRAKHMQKNTIDLMWNHRAFSYYLEMGPWKFDVIPDAFLPKFKNAGFIMVISGNREPKMIHVNCPQRANGPGIWGKTTILEYMDSDSEYKYIYWMIGLQ